MTKEVDEGSAGFGKCVGLGENGQRGIDLYPDPREGVQAGAALNGWVMEQDRVVEMRTVSDIPIGHKIALHDLEPGATVMKYGVDIGKVVAPIKAGEHLHVHNVKTKRW